MLKKIEITFLGILILLIIFFGLGIGFDRYVLNNCGCEVQDK